MTLWNLFDISKVFPFIKKKDFIKNLLLYPIGILTTLSLTLLIQEKTKSQVNIITEIVYNVEVCNEYKNKVFVSRAKRRLYKVAGNRNYGSPYGITLEASKVKGWGSVPPNECKSFSILELNVEPPKYSKYIGTDDWIHISTSNNDKMFPPQNLKTYINSEGRKLLKPNFCVTNKAFNLSSKDYRQLKSKTCPGYNQTHKKSTLPEGTYFVKFERVSPKKNKIVFR